MHRDESRSLFGAWAGAIFPLLPLTKRRDEEFSLHPDNSIVFQRFAGKAFPAVKARTCQRLLCHAIHKLLEPGLACVHETNYGMGRHTSVTPEAPGAGAMGSRHGSL